MRNWFTKLQSNPWLVKRLVVVALLAAVAGGGFWYGRKQGLAQGAKNLTEVDPANPSQNGGVVAFLYQDKAISREEFGEYLIARFGPERLEFMVNRKIVEIECQKKGISAAVDAEVEERLQRDLWAYGGGSQPMTLRDFENSVLRRFGKNLFEWKEDVIRPKIMMEKLVKATVTVKDSDLQEGFEARFGPKVECRMIVLDGKEMGLAHKVYERAKKGRLEFLAEAKGQFIKQLADTEGKVPAIHKHVGDRDLEDAAFRLKEGEISSLLPMKDGTCLILLCERHLPRDVSVKFEDVRSKLVLEMTELRVAQAVPGAFAEMRRNANPQLLPLERRGEPSSGLITTSFTRDSPLVPRPVQLPPGVTPTPLPDNTPPAALKIPNPNEKNEKK